jgi:hypothetical protein
MGSVVQRSTKGTWIRLDTFQKPPALPANEALPNPPPLSTFATTCLSACGEIQCKTLIANDIRCCGLRYPGQACDRSDSGENLI